MREWIGLFHLIILYLCNFFYTMKKIEFKQEGNIIHWDYVAPEMPEYVDTYTRILKFSIPLLKDKVSFGRKLWDGENTILW